MFLPFIASDHEQLRPNEQIAVGNVNNTADVDTDNQVSAMNASTTVAVNGVHPNNTTTTIVLEYHMEGNIGGCKTLAK